jgi:hypothetical protein
MGVAPRIIQIWTSMSRTSPKGCPKHQGHKGDPGVTPGTCGAGGEKAQMILVWVKAPGVGNASHPRRLGFIDGRRGSLLCNFAKRTHDAHHINLYSLENYRVSLICSVFKLTTSLFFL